MLLDKGCLVFTCTVSPPPSLPPHSWDASCLSYWQRIPPETNCTSLKRKPLNGPLNTTPGVSKIKVTVARDRRVNKRNR